MTTSQGAGLSAAQFERLKKIIYDRSGIHFQPAKKYVLETRLARRLEELGFDDYDQYITFLSFGPYRDDEFQEMFNRITINETSFFRNETQLRVFESDTLPKLLEARRNTKRLRIWSAAASSGEEAYTLAIILHRTLGIRMADWHIEILGTDISEKVLLQASSGRYTHYSVRSVAPLVLQRYFTQKGGFYEIDPTLKQLARFEKLNLKDTFAAKRFGVFDVIFCRNVLIYFDEQMRAGCARMFHDQLAADGRLYLGHSETLRGLDVGFQAEANAQSFAYSKLPAAQGAKR